MAHYEDDKFGMESLSFRGSLFWNNLNDNINELPTVASLNAKIKAWMGEKFNCKICTCPLRYVACVSFS